MADEPAAPVPTFKKRTKATFKRRHSSSEGEQEASDNSSSNHTSVAEILRQRRQGKIRRTPAQTQKDIVEHESVGQEIHHEVERTAEDGFEGMRNRFVKQTGQRVGLYDKQMNDYVEAGLAEYRNAIATLRDSPSHLQDANSTSTHMENTFPKKGKGEGVDQRSVTAGKLMEVDLATSQTDTQEKAVKEKRVRLGRDGKPWRSRKRRNSDQLARDKLVEDMLKDTPLSRFHDSLPASTLSTSQAASTANADTYVDEDSVLANFKNSYQDPDLRSAPRRPATTGKTGAEERKGPRLGGSKNARKAMEIAESSAKKT